MLAQARSNRRLQTGFVFSADENGIKQQSRIGGGARQRTDAIEAGRKGNDVGDGDAADRGLEPDDAAEGCRDADGAAGVRANAAVAKAGGNGCGRTSAGTAGDAGAIPGITRGPEVR